MSEINCLILNLAACVQAGQDFFKAVELEKAKVFPMLYKPKKRDGVPAADETAEDRAEKNNEDVEDEEGSLLSD